MDYLNTIIRLAEVAPDNLILESAHFDECHIKGPAVVIPQGCTFNGCTFRGPDIEALLWEIPLARPNVIGAIVMRACVFNHSIFEGIGFAGNPDSIAHLRTSLSRAT